MNIGNNEMAIDRRNKLPKRSEGNMRRALMHPRDLSCISIVQQPV